MFMDADEARALAEERNARQFRLLEEMKPADLATFLEMMVIITGAENGLIFAAKLMGEGQAIMRMKHGDVCGNCGEKHGPDPLEEERQKLENERAVTDEGIAQALKDYNLQIVDGEVFCLGCGMKYVSVEDRMLRAPGTDGCHGCHHKSAHGG